MARQLRGPCAFCGRSYAASGIRRHLGACAARGEAVDQADVHIGSHPSEVLHLQVRSGVYWLEMEARGESTLRDLDHYLRAIWMEECCNHMSAFSPANREGRRWIRNEVVSLTGCELDELSDDDAFLVLEGGSFPMAARMSVVFSREEVVHYQYDMGSTTGCTVGLKSVRQGGFLSDHPIYLMGRNEMPPDESCSLCGESAVAWCEECAVRVMNEDGEVIAPLMCLDHAEDRSHLEQHHESFWSYDQGINSPRLGVECGYEGPAEPPY